MCVAPWVGRLLCLCMFTVALSITPGDVVAAASGNVTIGVRDAAGSLVDGAVVALYGNGLTPMEAVGGPVHVMDQIDKQFSPRVLVIRPGERISFPNSDNIRHHVYSFSPAKTFELPLYHGISTEPIVFETSGTVAVGCNIHDRMSAHIYVIDAPRFAVSEAGKADFGPLPDGQYEYTVHHRDLAGGATERQAFVVAGGAAVAGIELEMMTVPTQAPETLSPLEQKFQALRRAR